MLKWFFTLILVAFMSVSNITYVHAEDSISIVLRINDPVMDINGVDMPIDQHTSAVPIIHNDRTLVPIRTIIENMGGDIFWSDKTRSVDIMCKGHAIKLQIDNCVAYVDEKECILDSAPIIVNSRTMLPIRFIAEKIGLYVDWNEGLERITISNVMENKGNMDPVAAGDRGVYYAIKTNGDLYQGNLFYDEMPLNRISNNVTSITANYYLTNDNSVYKTEAGKKIVNDVSEISSNDHTLLVKTDNSLWGFGNNYYGQLGQGELNKTVDEQILEGMKYKNKTTAYPQKINEPVKIMDNVIYAVAGNNISVVIKADNTVWTFGDGMLGQLGDGHLWVINNEPQKVLTGIKRIFASGESVFAIDEDDMLWHWGNLFTGYAGIKEDDYVSTPTKYVENVCDVVNFPGYNLVVKTDGTLWVYGMTDVDCGDYKDNYWSGSDRPVKLAEDVDSIYYYGYDDRPSDEKQFDNYSYYALVLMRNHNLMSMEIKKHKSGEPEIEFRRLLGDVMLK